MVKFSRGFTLMELLVATGLLSVVFLVSIGVYTTALKFTQSAQIGVNNIATQPAISVEKIAKRVRVSNLATVPTADQLNVRSDYPWTNYNSYASLGTMTTDDDGWWHYRLLAGALYGKTDNNPANTVGIGDTLLISNVSSATFTLVNPTLVRIEVTTTTPASQIDTQVALGAGSK